MLKILPLLAALSALRPPQFPDLVAGERAPETVVVPKPLEFEDQAATLERRQRAVEMAIQVFLVDQTGAQEQKLREGLERELGRLIAADTGSPELLEQLRMLGAPAARAQVLAEAEGIGRRLLLRGVVGTAREAEALAALDHPNVVKVHAAGDVAGRPYLVCELIAGARPLDQGRHRPVDPFHQLRVRSG